MLWLFETQNMQELLPLLKTNESRESSGSREARCLVRDETSLIKMNDDWDFSSQRNNECRCNFKWLGDCEYSLVYMKLVRVQAQKSLQIAINLSVQVSVQTANDNSTLNVSSVVFVCSSVLFDRSVSVSAKDGIVVSSDPILSVNKEMVVHVITAMCILT